MAQFFTNFNSDTAGNPPAGFFLHTSSSIHWDMGEVVTDPEFNQIYQVDPYAIVYLDSSTGITESTNSGEIFVKFRYTDIYNNIIPITWDNNLDSTFGSVRYFFLQLLTNGNASLRGRNGNNYSNVTSSISHNLNNGDIVCVRAERAGTTLRARWWLDGDSEPSGWLLSGTSTYLTTRHVGGAVGGNVNDNTGKFDLIAIGVGDHGDPAPTEAPSIDEEIELTNTASLTLNTYEAQLETTVNAEVEPAAGTLNFNTHDVTLEIPVNIEETVTAPAQLQLNTHEAEVSITELVQIEVFNTATYTLRAFGTPGFHKVWEGPLPATSDPNSNRLGNMHIFHPPFEGTYTLEVYGAAGGLGSGDGQRGLGAYVKGDLDVSFPEYNEIYLGVGRRGEDSPNNAGGGGATAFVVPGHNFPIVMAGGGGGFGVGTGTNSTLQEEAHASLTNWGKHGSSGNADENTRQGGEGSQYAGGGSGWVSHGEDSVSTVDTGGKRWTGTGTRIIGGVGIAEGGFGGAGGSDDPTTNGSCGGGGGYSGGGAGSSSTSSEHAVGGGGGLYFYSSLSAFSNWETKEKANDGDGIAVAYSVGENAFIETTAEAHVSNVATLTLEGKTGFLYEELNQDIQAEVATLNLNGLQAQLNIDTTIETDKALIEFKGLNLLEEVFIDASSSIVFSGKQLNHVLSTPPEGNRIFTNFAEYPVQQGLPYDWTEILANPNLPPGWEITASPTGSTNRLYADKNNEGRAFEARWDSPGIDVGDIDIYLEFVIHNNAPLIFFRASGWADDGYYIWFSPEGFSLIRYEGLMEHEEETLASVSLPMYKDLIYRAKVRAWGDNIRIKVWPHHVAEPSWMVNVNDSIYPSGHFTIAAFNPNFSIETVGIGVNQEEAPTESLPVIIEADSSTVQFNTHEPEVLTTSSEVDQVGQLRFVGRHAVVTPAAPETNTILIGSTQSPHFQVYNVDEGELDPEWPEITDGAVVDGALSTSHVAVVHSGGNRLTVIDVKEKEKLTGYPSLDAEPWSVAVSPSYIAAGTQKYTRESNSGANSNNTVSNTLALIDVNTKQVQAHPGVNSTIFALEFSPDNTKLAMGLAGAPYFQVLDLETRTIENWESPIGMVTDIIWTQDSIYIAGVGGVQRYDTGSRVLDSAWNGLLSHVWSISIRLSGDRIAAYGDEGYIINTSSRNVTHIDRQVLRNAKGRSVAWVGDEMIAFGQVWYDSDNRKALFYDTTINDFVINMPDIYGTAYLLKSGRISEVASQPRSITIEAQLGPFTLRGRDPLVEALILIEPDTPTVQYVGLSPTVESTSANVTINTGQPARATFTAHPATVTPILAGIVVENTPRLLLRGREIEVVAATDVPFKLVAGADTSMTALDAEEVDEFDLGLCFYGASKETRLRIGNPGTVRAYYIIFATSENKVLQDAVQFSLDGTNWDYEAMVTVAPNALSPLIHVRLTVPTGTPIGDSTFLLNVEGGLLIWIQ